MIYIFDVTIFIFCTGYSLTTWCSFGYFCRFVFMFLLTAIACLSSSSFITRSSWFWSKAQCYAQLFTVYLVVMIRQETFFYLYHKWTIWIFCLFPTDSGHFIDYSVIGDQNFSFGIKNAEFCLRSKSQGWVEL